MKGFDDALKITLQFEGGKVDDPNDPGGRTAYGVTQRTFDEWRDGLGQPHADVWTILPDEVAAIYRKEYWGTAGCDNLDWPLSLFHFDAAVNHGLGRAGRWLLAASWADVPTQVEAFAYLTLRREHILGGAQQRYMKGLLNRIDGLRKEAEL